MTHFALVVDEACASLQKVLALDPNHSDAHCNLGNVLLHQGKLDAALISYQKVLALNPNQSRPCAAEAGKTRRGDRQLPTRTCHSFR
ncbi:MAG TPA: tetratricopeptide repeat protein [Steroidobacteraceae bacterium]|nr:tetratricopeptide repeat protein [Steroidobacteraceae bacterium]